MVSLRVGIVCLALGFSGALAFAQEGDPQLAQQAYSILSARCSRCHGGSAKQAGLDVLSRENMLQERGDIGSRFAFIVPGNAEKSQLISAVENEYMPQEGSPESKAMTAAERGLIKKWVLGGAPFPKRRDVQFISEKQVLTAIREHLLKARADDRRHLRFYTFNHLQNNPAVTDLDQRLYRAALAKVINSLSMERSLYLPQPLPGTGDTVYVIDLRRLGWDRRNLWGQILSHYPYGLKYDQVKDEELQQLGKDVTLLAGGDLAYLRADWFVVTAPQPPLYHIMLDIPDRLSVLEQRLDIDLKQNFLQGNLQRSGYAKSGVSKQNRLLERHTSSVTPYFWISWDFLPRRAKGDLVRFPLGPVFAGNPFRKQAFEHDGGEVIWSMPNGMQAYMLVKADGGRIDAGPVDVVFDRSAILGSPAIINGISCMYCHRDGMIAEFRDEIRGADAVRGDARQKILELFPPHDDMQRLVRQDQELFMRSLERVMGPYLKVGADAGKAINEFPEPVGKVAEMYSRDLTPNEIALELGIEKVETLQTIVSVNRELLRYGLGTVVQNPPGTIKREKWETREGTSLMQDVAVELFPGIVPVNY